MNKNLKVISTVALAGLLAVNGFAPRALAVTDTISTTPAAIYSNLKGFENEKIATFVLADANDCVTFKEIANSSKFSNVTKFNGSSIPNDNELVKTGDTFVANGVTYTVVIYGDVNKDGYVDGQDASAIAKSLMRKVTLDKYQQEAADVVNDGELDGQDAAYIAKFAIRKNDTSINKLPEDENVVEDLQYTFTVNGNNIVNNTNTAAEINVKPKTVLTQTSQQKALKLKIEDTKLKTIAADTDATITMPLNTTEQDVSGKVNFAGLDDGIYTVELYYVDETVTPNQTIVVGKTNVTVNTTEPKATNVSTNRESSRTAKLSLEAYGTSDIKKVYYIVEEDTIAKATKADVLASTNVINVSGNKVENFEVASNLNEQHPAIISYVLENSYGSVSDVKKVIIAQDNATAEEDVKEIVAPNLAEGEDTFTWTLKDGVTGNKAYTVNLIKNGTIVDEKIIDAAEKNEKIKLDEFSTVGSISALEEGKYQIAVKVNGATTGATKDSGVVTSDEIEISKLTAVSSVNIAKNNSNKYVLTWSNSNDVTKMKGYSIELYKYTADANRDKQETSVGAAIAVNLTSNKDINEYEFTELDTAIANTPNTEFFAKISVVAKTGDNSTKSSEKASSNQVFELGAPSIAVDTNAGKKVVTDNSATIVVTKPVSVLGKTTSYRVEKYKLTGTATLTLGAYTLVGEQSNVKLDSANKFVVTDLEEGATYKFVLVATVDGTSVSAESAAITTFQTIPSIQNLTVATWTDAMKANSGKVAVNKDSKKIAINGKEYSYDSADNYSDSKLDRDSLIISALNVGDVVTISGDDVTLTLNDEESTRDFAAVSGLTMTDINLNVTSNKFAKTITGAMKSLTLSGNGAIYKLTATATNGITVNNGVEVSGDKTYTVSAGSKVIINKINVTATNATKITAKGQTLDVIASASELTFETSITTTVNVVKSADNTALVQSGAVNIINNGGTFTLSSANVNLSGAINVTAKAGTVDLQTNATGLNGTKNVTINKAPAATVTIKANSTTANAPIKMTNVDLKDYNDTELLRVTDVNADNIEEVRAYINSFGINNLGAKITAYAANNKVDITFGSTTNAVSTTIKNIK